MQEPQRRSVQEMALLHLRAWSLGFRVWGFGLRAWSSGF